MTFELPASYSLTGLRAADAAGNRLATLTLGLGHLLGHLRKDNNEGEQLLRRAAAAHPVARLTASWWLDGELASLEALVAIADTLSLAENRSPTENAAVAAAQFVCAWTYSLGKLPPQAYGMAAAVPADLERALQWADGAAAVAYAPAQYLVGFCHDTGDGLPTDKAQAVEHYQRAAALGYGKAMCNLGVCHEFGEGTARDLEQAVRLYSQAVEQDIGQAMANLGGCYEYGDGVAQDLREAARLYQLGADQDNRHALTNLALCYAAGGGGVPRDERRALALLRRAAEQGHNHALYELGQALLGLGDCAAALGGARDAAGAAELFRHAADNGYWRGELMLGELRLAGGAAGPRDLHAAAAHFRRAAEDELGTPALCRLAEIAIGGYLEPEPDPSEAAALLYRADDDDPRAAVLLSLVSELYEQDYAQAAAFLAVVAGANPEAARLLGWTVDW